LRHEHAIVEPREYVRVFDQYQIAQWTCVGHDHHLRAWPLCLTVPYRGKVLLKIFESILLHLMFLQEAIQLVTRRNPKQRPELIACYAALAVGLQGKGFQRIAIRIGCAKLPDERIRKVESDAHRFQV